MMIPFFAVIALAVLIMQLVLCFSDKSTLLKAAPTVLLLASVVVCCMVSVYGEGWLANMDGAVYAAGIYSIILFLFFTVDVLAWAMYGIIRWLKSLKK